MGATTVTRTPIISADSHVNEPVDLWSTRLPQRPRERAAQIQLREGNRYIARLLQLISEGKARPVAPTGRETGQPETAGVEKRQCDMEADGIAAEVIYATNGLFILALPDPELQLACARIYNDWAHEVFGAHFDIFMPAAVVPLVNVADGVKELERVAKLGFRAVSIAAAAPPGKPYNLLDYEPFWSAAEAAGIPLSFHVGTGFSPILERGDGGAVINYAYVGIMAQETLAYLCASGVLARHPELHVAIVEGGSGWLAWLMERMDEAYTEHHSMVRPQLEMLPSDYYGRQGHVSFQFDRSGLNNIHLTGADCLTWGSDYPHPESTWPHSRERLAEQFAGVPAEARCKITGETAARIYRFPVG
jgi:predicted TIM-barrel fold metal-dependent hydrolase